MKRWRIVFRFVRYSIGVALIYFIFCLPKTLFDQPHCKVLLDRKGQLLEARIASDGQWRFPLIDSVPEKFKKCILRFEDKNFKNHIGVDPMAIGRAVYLNVKNKSVVSGGSTITMQTIRLLRKNKSRTIREKIIEIIWATRLECSFSKKEILQFYATHAPFGGNVVGLETASWRYLNRPPNKLSWAEAAMLAVLPNAPGLIHMGKNREKLRAKRDRLLEDMVEDDMINEQAYLSAIHEPLPSPLNTLPHYAYHLIERDLGQGKIRTTINKQIQAKFNSIAQQHNGMMKRKEIHNLSAVLLSTKTGEVVSYIGNISNNNNGHCGKVDMLKSVRSSGSILKPFLFANSVSDGLITPKQILPDYPINFSGYRPNNYNPTHDGMVHADEALYRSLNIPSAWLLSEYGPSRFKMRLNQLGLTSVNRPASNYGLSLILGGAEVNLLELTTAYASLGNKLLTEAKDVFMANVGTKNPLSTSICKLEKGSIYATLQALIKTNRPETEAYWKNFESGRKVAWKTGTSYGNRDAWAVGVTPEYTIGVWVGNSSGEGITGLTGLNNAAPLLFNLFNALPSTTWFEPPFAMFTTKICKASGMKASANCNHTYSIDLPCSSKNTPFCTYHKNFFVNPKNHRVNKSCSNERMEVKTYFILPSFIAHYYQKKNPTYQNPPKWDPTCQQEANHLNIYYPFNKGKISLPKNQESKGITAKAFHSEKTTTLYWELNGVFIGTTVDIHEKIILPNAGKNKLHITDDHGIQKKISFEVT